MSHRFEGKTAIVTGAARGMGEAVAGRLYEEGANVVLLDVEGDGVESAAAALDSAGERSLARRCDVTSAADAQAAVAAALERFGRVDCLVNCAGVLSLAPFAEPHRGPVGRGDGRQRQGRVPDDAGRAPGAARERRRLDREHREPVRQARRGAAGSLLRLEGGGDPSDSRRGAQLAPEVRVNSICPGYVDTAMQDQAAAYVAAETGSPVPELMAEWVKEVPMGPLPAGGRRGEAGASWRRRTRRRSPVRT